MPWSDHIIPAPHAGTRPVFKRTGDAVEDVLAALAKVDDDVGDHVNITREEMRACFEYASTLVADRMMQRADPGGAKTHVSSEQLKRAFRRHKDAGLDGAERSDSSLLLVIYAIECGLKRVLLDRRGKKTTLKLDKDDLTHHLDELLRLVGQTPRFHAVSLVEPDEDVGPDRIHEALRYGRRLSVDSRRRLLISAKAVLKYLEENIR
ncbi:hypothetical protein predicted by Glimmer/Critica [Sorangium cellulosum So ce56]|uniref:Uncharacterized protein n=1 Tax=Sorangium cellulosum (strain So ce56) TaxID=448385 RepID=A9GPV7_SORC5|nr:hypothetical protein [Sorangium cellulosum]CAN96812.1 hypothetical protein predicted by Glimmer/Critica [Sorangium cellulosum So ce56]